MRSAHLTIQSQSSKLVQIQSKLYNGIVTRGLSSASDHEFLSLLRRSIYRLPYLVAKLAHRSSSRLLEEANLLTLWGRY